jgi:hypothetical protein
MYSGITLRAEAAFCPSADLWVIQSSVKEQRSAIIDKRLVWNDG